MHAYFISLDRKRLFSSLPEKEIDSLECSEFTVFSSSLISTEDSAEVEKNLSEDLHALVITWFQEKRYIFHLILSAIIFLIVYFIGSVGIRDSIPLIDEIAAALILSILFYFFIRKHDVKASVIKEKEEQIRRKIEMAENTYLVFIRDIEELYSSLKEGKEGRRILVNKNEEDLFLEFRLCLIQEIKREDRALLKAIMRNDEERTTHFIRDRKMDRALFLSYKAILSDYEILP